MTQAPGAEADSVHCRLLIDPALPGADNMAIDEAMLESAAAIGQPTLRWYAWSKPTLSLGYFQSWSDRPTMLAPLTTVRRLSGGGAILHDQEATYSLVIPNHRDHAEIRELVRGLHGFVADWLNAVSPRQVTARLHEGRPKPPSEEPFLCFQRRAASDLVLDAGDDDHKILGSAQRSRSGVLLQHGSILLSASDHAPMLRGINDLGFDVHPETLLEYLTQMAARHWGWTFVRSTLSDGERSRARELVHERYTRSEWNAAR